MHKDPRLAYHQRTSHLQLPAGDEIMHISDAEEKRQLLPAKQFVHYPDFSTINMVYKHYGIDSAIFETPDLSPQYILDTGAEQVNSLSKTILKSSLSETEISILSAAYAYLSEEDPIKPADYIYVFGSKSTFRVQKAIELYLQDLAPKLILSGRSPFYGSTSAAPEAQLYAATAIHAGVPESKIIIEDASITLPDNVRRTLNLLDSQKLPYHSFIIVNSPYTQRRGWCSWKKHTTDDVQIYRVNSLAAPRFDRDNWYNNLDGLRVVLNEFVKLRNTIAFNDA